LLAFAVEFERESSVSLAIYSDVLRVLGEKGTAVSEISSLSGVSKEAVAMALGFLAKRGYLKVMALEGKRGKRVLLDSQGVEACEACIRLLARIEHSWAQRYGEDQLQNLWSCLERIAGDGTPEGSPLFAGLEPYPDGWRAKVPRPKTLPHFPMVLHRGGYPDGS
jgi:DNA-binding MarR family transcriptional regulator